MSRCDRATVRLKADTTYDTHNAYVVSGFSRTVVAVICLLMSISGCTSSHETATIPDRPALRPVSLPDMTGTAESVQAQLRDRYATLKLTIDRAAAPASELAGAYGEMGKLLIAAEYLDAAEACFVNAQALEPDDMRWPYYLGHVYRFRNEPAKAAGFFAFSLTLEPAHVPTLVWLGEMRLAQDRPDEAERFFTRGLAIQSRSTAALSGLGRAALARQQYAQAVTHLEAALALDPQASRLHYPLAMAYRGLGDRRNADAHLRLRGDVEVSSADPLLDAVAGLLKNAAAYEVRASEAMGQREWADAIRNLRVAIEMAPQNPGTRLNLGTALYMTGDAAGALEQFETAVRLAPESPKAHYSIGVILEAGGRDQDAIEQFSAAVKYDPAYVEARMQLADALRRTGRLDASLSHYAEVIKTSPAISQAVFGYAMALVRLRRYQEAGDRLSDGMKTHPDQPGFAHALARLRAAAPDDRVRDGRTALALLEPLLKQQKTIGLAETMAMALAEVGQFEEAASWQRDAMTGARQAQPDTLARLSENLKLYENRKPCRIPWREDDPVFHPRPVR